MATRKLRMGMIGGGQGAFIGSIYRTAATMDGKIELVLLPDKVNQHPRVCLLYDHY